MKTLIELVHPDTAPPWVAGVVLCIAIGSGLALIPLWRALRREKRRHRPVIYAAKPLHITRE